MFYLLSFAFFIGTSFAIARFLGKKRQIGFKRSLLFCITLTPILGFIITMTSSKYYSDNPKPSLFKKIFGWILIAFALLALLGQATDDRLSRRPPIVELMPIFGILGLGTYIIERGKGKRFDDNLVKID